MTQYNSNNSLTPEFNEASFEKKNNLDELINIPTKAEERSMIQISFRTQDPNIRQAQSGIRVKNYSWSTIHCVFKNLPIRSIYLKNTQSLRFLRPNSSVRKPIHPLLQQVQASLSTLGMKTVFPKPQRLLNTIDINGLNRIPYWVLSRLHSEHIKKSLITAEHVLSNNDRFQSHFCDVVFTYPPPSAKGEREL